MNPLTDLSNKGRPSDSSAVHMDSVEGISYMYHNVYVYFVLQLAKF
jgi:hypothetical protein